MWQWKCCGCGSGSVCYDTPCTGQHRVESGLKDLSQHSYASPIPSTPLWPHLYPQIEDKLAVCVGFYIAHTSPSDGEAEVYPQHYCYPARVHSASLPHTAALHSQLPPTLCNPIPVGPVQPSFLPTPTHNLCPPLNQFVIYPLHPGPVRSQEEAVKAQVRFGHQMG